MTIQTFPISSLSLSSAGFWRRWAYAVHTTSRGSSARNDHVLPHLAHLMCHTLTRQFVSRFANGSFYFTFPEVFGGDVLNLNWRELYKCSLEMNLQMAIILNLYNLACTCTALTKRCSLWLRNLKPAGLRKLFAAQRSSVESLPLMLILHHFYMSYRFLCVRICKKEVRNLGRINI